MEIPFSIFSIQRMQSDISSESSIACPMFFSVSLKKYCRKCQNHTAAGAHFKPRQPPWRSSFYHNLERQPEVFPLVNLDLGYSRLAKTLTSNSKSIIQISTTADPIKVCSFKFEAKHGVLIDKFIIFFTFFNSTVDLALS